jgi:hypothetical protein
MQSSQAQSVYDFPDDFIIRYSRFIDGGWTNMTINENDDRYIHLSSDYKLYNGLSHISSSSYTVFKDEFSNFIATSSLNTGIDTVIYIETEEFNHSVSFTYDTSPESLRTLIHLLQSDFNTITGGHKYFNAWPVYMYMRGREDDHEYWINAAIMRGNGVNVTDDQFEITFIIGTLNSNNTVISDVVFKNIQIVEITEGYGKAFDSALFYSDLSNRDYLVAVNGEIALINNGGYIDLKPIDEEFLDVNTPQGYISINFLFYALIMLPVIFTRSRRAWIGRHQPPATITKQI